MQKDSDGFLFPEIDATLCVDCGLCAKVCPININTQDTLVFNQAQYAVAAVHKNKNIAKESSSGGAFTAIAQAFADDNDCVFFGAEMFDDFSVQDFFSKHTAFSNLSSNCCFVKSIFGKALNSTANL